MNLEFMKFLRKERKHRRRDRLRRHDNTLYCVWNGQQQQQKD